MVAIQEFREAWADKPNRAAALAIAEAYVAENAALLDPILGGKTSDELVQVIDLARATGNEDMVTTVTMWELAKYERRDVGGSVRARPVVAPALRVVKGGN